MKAVAVGDAGFLAEVRAWSTSVPDLTVVAATESTAQAPSLARAHGAEIVVLSCARDDAAIALIDQLRGASSFGPVVVVDASDPAFDRRALRAGALEVFVRPLDGVATATLQEAVAELRRRSAVRPIAAPADAATRPMSRAPLVAIVSAKGGVGRSFVAANLASVLAKDARVALCDLDLQFGDISSWGTEQPAERTIDQLAAVVSAGEVQLADVQTVGVTRFGGVTLLPGARSPMDGAAWAADRGARALRLVAALRRWFDLAIVDDLPGLLEPVVGIARNATLLIVVTSAEVGALRATKRYLELLDRFAPVARIVVVNRSDRGVSKKLARAAIGEREKTVFIKEDRTLARRLVVEGLAAAQQRGRGVSRSFAALATTVRTAVEAPR